MNIIKIMCFQLTLKWGYLGVLLGLLFVFVAMSGFLGRDTTISWTLLTPLFFGIVGAIFGRYASKGLIRSRIKNEMEELELDVQNHPEKAAQEMLECEAAALEARFKLETLPALQAERLAGYQKKLAELSEARAQLAE